jgi:transcriptional regulator with XRE-family HTH domain
VIVLLAQTHERLKKGREIMEITLKAARVNAGLTQIQVADRVGTTKNTISNYERGITIPDMEMGMKLAAVYGCTVNDLKFRPNT